MERPNLYWGVTFSNKIRHPILARSLLSILRCEPCERLISRTIRARETCLSHEKCSRHSAYYVLPSPAHAVRHTTFMGTLCAQSVPNVTGSGPVKQLKPDHLPKKGRKEKTTMSSTLSSCSPKHVSLFC